MDTEVHFCSIGAEEAQECIVNGPAATGRRARAGGRRCALGLWALVVLLTGGAAWAQDAPAKPSLPVFPGAQGFGAATPAGRGGQVIRVTTLDATGPGSLDAALRAPGRRTIVFEVGGVIDLAGRSLVVTEPFVTVAGQTAPHPGITILRGSLRVQTHDVLIQHLAVRPGDGAPEGAARWEPDAISIGGPEGTEVHDVVVDHCSFTWAIDENASVSGKSPPRDVTYSHCIIAEGLSHSKHGKGEHSKGSLVMDGAKRVSFVGCLFAHNFRRNPYFKSGTSGVVANCLIYNPGELGVHISNFQGQEPKVSIVGNVFLAGADTPDGLGLVAVMGRASVYLKDNLARDGQNRERLIVTRGGAGEVGKWSQRPREVKEAPEWPEHLTVRAASEVPAYLLKHVGSRPAHRDAVDARIVESARKGEGRIIDSQDEVGGYPKPKPTRRKCDLPRAPDSDSDNDGYTALEEWLHKAAGKVE